MQCIGLYCNSNPSQRGRFWCELPDSNGTICTLFVNIVNDIPAIIGQPISQTVLNGEDAMFMINVSLNILMILLHISGRRTM